MTTVYCERMGLREKFDSHRIPQNLKMPVQGMDVSLCMSGVLGHDPGYQRRALLARSLEAFFMCFTTIFRMARICPDKPGFEANQFAISGDIL